MKVLLANGKELNPIQVQGSPKYVQGFNRDCLTFVFDGDADMNELDSLFTEKNCEVIKIGDNEAVYNDYVVRAELKQSFEQAQRENGDSPAQDVKRITVSMAQRTYLEKQFANMADEVTNTQLALVELYEGVM